MKETFEKYFNIAFYIALVVIAISVGIIYNFNTSKESVNTKMMIELLNKADMAHNDYLLQQKAMVEAKKQMEKDEATITDANKQLLKLRVQYMVGATESSTGEVNP